MRWSKSKQSLFTLGDSSFLATRENEDNFSEDEEDEDYDDSPWPVGTKHARTSFGAEGDPCCVV